MPEAAAAAPTRVEHLLPNGTAPGEVDLSIVVPALDESITVGEFVDWCLEGLKRAGVTGQVLIVDSSTDETPQIALARGAEILRTPKRGLGRAYLDAIPYIRGKWVVMGDADLTYDFRELAPFVAEFRRGAEFVMGSRFIGNIEAGATCPPFTAISAPQRGRHHLDAEPDLWQPLQRDIHCGMRGLTRSALLRIDLRSQSWEYASEMVLKAARLKLRIAEVPVKFYRDREGRTSHHRRLGWLSPWIAGWLNLKVMLVYSPDTFLLGPGTVLMVLGLLIAFVLSFGPVTVGGIGFNLYWMLLGVTCASLGYSCIQVGIIARFMHGLRLGVAAKLPHYLNYDRGMVLSGICVAIGFILDATLVWRYVNGGLKLIQISHPAILGLLLIILGFQTFGFTLLLEMSQRVAGRSEA